MQNAYHTLSQILMRQPNSEEISREIGVPMADVEFIMRITHGLISLEMDARDDENTAVMDLHEDYTYSPERALLKKSFRDDTLRVLNRLKDREKRILMYRYEFDGSQRYTLKTIGDKMGLSPETVRQIELKALRKIRSSAEELRNCMYVEAI
jgi:RNA polymerase primary sigma factor